MRWALVMVGLLLTAPARADDDCAVAALTCTDRATEAGTVLECRVPASAHVEHVEMLERSGDAPYAMHELARASGCRFVGAYLAAGETYLVIAKDATATTVARTDARTAPRELATVTPAVQHRLARRRPASGERVAAEILAGGGLAFAGGELGLEIGLHASGTPGDGVPDNTVWLAYAGAVAGVATGVWAAGPEGGSLLATFAGAVLGGGLAVAIDLNVHDTGLALFALPLAGALAGFHLSRTEVGAELGSVVMFDRGELRLGVPLAVRARGETSVSLLSGRF